MELWKKIRDTAVIRRFEDEAIYEAAVHEVASGRRRDGLWAKAVISSNGDKWRAETEYFKLLIRTLRDEQYVATRLNETREDRNHIPPEQQGPAPSAPPNPPPRPMSDAELMEKFDITFDGELYHYKTYRYEKLADAVNYARLGRE